PPCRSNSPPDHAPPARRENSRPTAPVPQSAPCAGVDADADAASVRDSITPPPTSSVAAFRHAPATRPPTPSALPPASAQNAPPPPHRTSPAPAAAPAAETSPYARDSTAVPRCDAAAPQRLPRDSASTTASPAGSSRP